MLILQFLNGLQYAMLLFMLAIGLSIVLGLMNFINLAHGTIYMAGAYAGLAAARSTSSFWVALVVAPLAAAAIGALLYTTLLQRLQSQSPMKQVLVTFGLIYVGFDLVRMLWGDAPQSLAVPDLLSGSVTAFGQSYPLYRLFVIVLGVALFGVLHVLLERTRLGAVIRAGVDDKVMLAALGIDIDKAFLAVFSLGCALAGLAGVVAAPLLQIYPGMDIAIIIPALIVVVVGGPGRLSGAFVGAVLIGLLDTFGIVFLPALSSFAIYALLALVLILRPGGLLRMKHGR